MRSPEIAIQCKARNATRTRFACLGMVLLLLGLPVKTAAAPSTILISPNSLYSWTSWAELECFALLFTNAAAADSASGSLVVLQSNGKVADLTDFPALLVPSGLSNVAVISVCVDVALALTSNGMVNAWGENYYGETNVPKGLSNVIAIAAGWYYSLALQGDGRVVSWGESTNVPSGLSNVVAIAANYARCLALQANGNVVEWGAYTYPVPVGLSNVIAISSAWESDLALQADGTVIAWSTTTTNPLPPGITNTVAIAGGSNSLLALQADGSVVSGGQPPYIPSFSGPVSNAFAISVDAVDPFGIVITGDGSPVFTVQPGSQVTGSGNTIWLHARAVGTQPMAYQWQLSGTNLSGATGRDLIITNATAANSGEYQALVTNSVGWAASSVATVTVQPPPIRIPTQLSAPIRQSNGSFIIAANATNGAAFLLSNPALFIFEASSDLINWNPLISGVSLTNGAIDLRDPAAATSPARFYRLLRQ